MKILLCLVLFLASLSCLRAETSTDAKDVSYAKIDLPNGTYSIFDVANLLRKRFFVVLEYNLATSGVKFDKDGNVINPTVTLKEEVPSLFSLLELVKKDLGYDYQIDGNSITIYDPSTRVISDFYPINALLDEVNFSDVTATEVVDILIKDFHLPLSYKRFGKEVPEKKFSLHAKHIAVRELLNNVSHAAGFLGWSASSSFSPGSKSVVGVTITF